MKNRFFIIIMLFCLSGIVYSQTDSLAPVWPTPPDRARIKHVLTISSLDSFEKQQGFFSGVFSFLFGGNQSSNLLVQPLGIAVAKDGTLYITDPGAKGVHVINQKEKEYEFFNQTELGTFLSPVGCAISNEGTIFISDSERGDIIALDEDRDILFKISEHLVRPTGIQIHSNRLYVADAGRHAIIVFDLKGKYLIEFGHRGEGAGEFNYPVQLSVSSDSIIVVDGLNYRIQKFDLEGHFGSMFGKQGNVTGRFASPKGIALDSDDNIYVTDGLMDCIQIFNPKGELLLVVGKNGNRAGEFMTPSGITIDTNDNIYVVESLNRRIQVFRYLK